MQDAVALNAGTLTSVKIDVFGDAPSLDNTYVYTDEYAAMVALDPSRGTLTDINGGTDWINAAAVSTVPVIDLTPGGNASSINGQSLTIAAGTVVENAIAGDGNDTLIGNAADNTLYGMRGDDTLYGGAGTDQEYGGAGDDQFRFAAGDLVTGEVVDGGLGHDRMEFAGGTFSLVGVTMSSIDEIDLAFTGVGATQLTLATAAQALLVTAVYGANDTIVFAGDFTLTQLAAMAAAGVEHVKYVSNGNAIMADYLAGVLRGLTVVDSDNNQPFQTVSYTYNAQGVVTSLETISDSVGSVGSVGLVELISFTGGVPTNTATGVLKTDGDGTPGNPNNFSWTAQQFIYAADGVTLASLLQTDDNTDTRAITYTGGHLTQFVFTENSSAAGIGTFSVSYTQGGVVTNLATVYDSGLMAETFYTNGIQSSYLQTDAGPHGVADPGYHTFAVNFTANGLAERNETYAFHNGDKSITNFEAGGTLQGGAFNDVLTGAVGARDIFNPTGGGNDYIANFENGTDLIDLSSFGFTNFTDVQAITVGNGANGIYLSFSPTSHLAVNGLSLGVGGTFDATDVRLV